MHLFVSYIVVVLKAWETVQRAESYVPYVMLILHAIQQLLNSEINVEKALFRRKCPTTYVIFFISQILLQPYALSLLMALTCFLLSQIVIILASNDISDQHFHRIWIFLCHGLLLIHWWPCVTCTLFIMHATYNDAKLYTPWFCKDSSSRYHWMLCITMTICTILRIDVMQKGMVATSILIMNLYYSLKGLKDNVVISVILYEFICAKRATYSYLLQYYRRELLFDVVEDKNIVQIFGIFKKLSNK